MRSRRWPLVLALLAGLAACAGDTELPTAPDRTPSLAEALSAPIVFRQISAGQFHTCGVDTDGVAWCWGENGSGELGTGKTLDRDEPVRVAGGLRFREVSAGEFHTCGVTLGNLAYCWGENSSGQLGDGARTNRLTPAPVAGGLDFIQVSAGVFYSCGIAADGAAWCWGSNNWGQLGSGTFDGRTRPGRVRGGHVFRRVSTGGDNTCGLRTDGAAFCWGLNQQGELGNGQHTGPELCQGEPCSSRPLRVVGGHVFRDVGASIGHACAIDTNAAAWCWGSNFQGQLGIGRLDGPDACVLGACSDRPLAVTGGLAFVAVRSFGFHTCGVTTAGTAWCWGTNPDGQLGIGNSSGPRSCEFSPCATAPTRVAGDRLWRQVSGGGRHTCGVTRAGRGFCWGSNSNGELGIGSEEGSTTPVAIAPPRR
jgi:alpha-tubulin suppressor-like RCC1 family protein